MSGRTAHATAASADRPEPKLRQALFREMLRIRLIEERIGKLYPEQEIRCPTHLCIGQEAPPVGVSAHLRRSDMVFSGHRSHGHYLAKGGDLKAMVAELYGKVTGCALGKGGSQHLIDLDTGFMGSAPILASTISVGVGAAWGQRMRGIKDMVTVIYFGDGAIEEGAFHESLNYAALQKLPVVFVCENNLYSVHTPLAERQPEGRTIAALARGHGIATLEGDGNDIEAVWRLGREAVSAARRGNGPYFLELQTYRYREHVGPNPDLDLKYRSSDEFAVWQKRDPVENYKHTLTSEKTLTAAELAAMEREIEAEVDAAVRFAKTSPFPPIEMLAQHVYPGARS